MKSRKHYSAQQKAQIVLELLKEEKTVAQIAAEYGIHPNQLHRWKKQALDSFHRLFEEGQQAEAAKKADHDRELNELYTEIGKLTTQLNWIKKNLVLSLPRSERRAMLERHHPKVALRDQADILSLSRASLYYRPVGPSPEEVASKHRIDEIYTQYPFYGSRRMTVALRKERRISRKTVQRYMRAMGLAAIYPGPNLSKRNAAHKIYPYLLRNVTSNHPNQIWGIEIV